MATILKSTTAVLALSCLIFAAPVTAGQLVIIASPDNSSSLALEDVARIFLGKLSRFPDGRHAEPLDINPNDPRYIEFTRRVLRKTPNQLRAYWAKRIFTGKGKPPRVIDNIADLRKLVAQNTRYLSYLDSDDADDSVRMVLIVEQ